MSKRMPQERCNPTSYTKTYTQSYTRKHQQTLKVSMPGVGNVGDFQKLFFRIHSKGEFAPIIRKTQCSGFAKRSITSRKTKRIQNTKHRNAIVSMHACPFHVNLYVLVKEVSVSSAYFCYKFVVCLIFLHFFSENLVINEFIHTFAAWERHTENH